MAIHKTVTHTGLYRRFSIKGDTPADMRRVFESYVAVHRAAMRDWLDDIERKAKAANCREVMGHVAFVRAAIKTGDAALAAYEGFRLAGVLERLWLEPFEPLVVTGRKVRDGARSAREVAHGTADEQQAKRRLIHDTYHRVKAKTGEKDTVVFPMVRKLLSGRFPEGGLSDRNIQRYKIL